MIIMFKSLNRVCFFSWQKLNVKCINHVVEGGKEKKAKWGKVAILN